MQISRKDIGYALYSRSEEALRYWLKDKILNLFGADWQSQVPAGIWSKAKEKYSSDSPQQFDDPLSLFEETDIPDLMEIVCYRNAFDQYIPRETMRIGDFRDHMKKLYDLRNRIAHVRHNFTALDLDLLMEIAKSLLTIVGAIGNDLRETLESINTNPETVMTRIPSEFLIYEDNPRFAHLNNLPPADFDPDGGFVGRKEDLARIDKLILGDLYRVVTISGAGGVGKTAIAHSLSENLLRKEAFPFDGLVWISAKDEKLSATGIEKIEPTVRNYEEVLDSILATLGWEDDLAKPIAKKEESVDVILKAGSKGILLVVDNLETIRDDRVIEFIKDFPPPGKVLITSRLGLGEVERRYPLKEMTEKDAIVLLRTVAREKGIDDLVRLPDDTLGKYVHQMSCYPLAIKWVLGQVALGTDINIAVAGLTAPTGDVVKFCFEYIFDSLLTEPARMVLYSLAVFDKPLTRGVLTHVANLEPDALDSAIRDLTLASLIIPNQALTSDGTLETRYELLPLTTTYIRTKLGGSPTVNRQIQKRIEKVRHLTDEADKDGRDYRYSLFNMGAKTEEEKIAATRAQTAHQKSQAGDYAGAVDEFKRATEIAPNFPMLYRNWAIAEARFGFDEQADALMKKATSMDSSDSRLWYSWANMERDRQRYENAATYMRKALELSPNDAPILGALGEIEKRRGNYEDASILFLKSIQGSKKQWNKLVCFTALADTLTRWGESFFRDKRAEEGLAKLRQAHQAAVTAAQLAGDDPRAKIVLADVCLSLGKRLLSLSGLDTARPYLEAAIVRNAQKYKVRRTTQYSCYLLASELLRQGKIDDAKHFYSIGLEVRLDRGRIAEVYKQLGNEFSDEITTGTLVRIVWSEGYGFLKPEAGPIDEVILRYTNVVPKISLLEFQELQGREFSFVLQPGHRGPNPEAKTARMIDVDVT